MRVCSADDCRRVQVMEEDEAAAGGKAEEEALEEQLEAEDAAAEGEEGAGAAEEEGVLKRKPLDAPTTRDEAAKVAKMGGAPWMLSCTRTASDESAQSEAV